MTTESGVVLPYSKAAFTDPRRFSFQIAITSTSGAGSSTLLKKFKDCFGSAREYRSGGDIMRVRQKEFGFSDIEAFAEHNKLHPEDGHDAWCEDQLFEFGRRNLRVLESRLAHMQMPYGFHQYLFCDYHIAASRMSPERIEKHFRGKSVEQITDSLKKRDEDDSSRYIPLYPGCIWQPFDFDSRINTAVRSEDEVFEDCIRNFAQFLDNLNPAHIVYSMTIPS
jgi:cytidylate kinase